MARPKYEAEDRTARDRLEDAFWELLAQYPVSEISVGMLCAQAKCNRGTFYYHFESIEHLAEQVAVENLPKQVPIFVDAYLSDARLFVAFDDEAKRDIERLCLLVGAHSTPTLVQATKDVLVACRLESMGLVWEELDACERVAVMFMADGILGVLARHANNMAGQDAVDLDTAFATVFELFSVPVLEQLRQRMGSREGKRC